MSKRYFVYILANCRRGVRYVGLSNDLIRRISQHKARAVPGFTRTYGVTLLVYYEEYESLLDARTREHTLKRWRRAWKFALIEKLNPDWRDVSEDLLL
jgi:putative endonuclease